jgi:hypothetical protein
MSKKAPTFREERMSDVPEIVRIPVLPSLS